MESSKLSMIRRLAWLFFSCFLVVLVIVGPVFANAATDDEILVSGVYFEKSIKEILDDIAGKVKINILTDGSVEGIATIELRNVPFERALAMILAPGGYTFKNMGGYYLVGVADPSNRTFIHLSETKVIRPSYISADVLLNVLPEAFTGFIKVDPTASFLVVTGSPELIERIQQDIAKIDQPTPVIVLDLAIIELLSKDAEKLFGVDLHGEFMTPQRYAMGTQTDDSLDELRYGRIADAMGLADTLKRLENEGAIRIYATPRIATPNNTEAEVFVGTDVELKLKDNTTQIVQVGTALKLKPRVFGSDGVVVSISPEISEVVTPKSDNPYVAMQYVTIDVRIADGETIIISDVPYSKQEDVSVKLSLFEYLFRGTSTTTETSLVFIVTVHILNPGLY